MASSLRRDNLVCFYCGKRSKLKKHGIRRWECASCEATNWLDANGEITDPPAFEASTAVHTVHYARPATQAFPGAPSVSESFRFCDTCLHNQHLWTSSLAQYSNDTDVPPSRAADRELLRFKQNLENLYPQVCEDCEDGAGRHLKKANRMAKADNLRIRLARTRTNRGTGKTRTWLEFLAYWGEVLYCLDMTGQIMLYIIGISKEIMAYRLKQCSGNYGLEDSADDDFTSKSDIASNVNLGSLICGIQLFPIAWVEWIAQEASSFARWTLVLTAISCWWNPKLRNMIRGFDRHIHGFLRWYYYQLILLVARVLFWSVLGARTLSLDFGPANLGAHFFMLCFTIFIAVISRHSIIVDHTKLFVSTPNQSELYTQQKKKHSVFSASGLSQALDVVLADDTGRSQTQHDIAPLLNVKNMPARQLQHEYNHTFNSESELQMSKMSDAEAILFMTNGNLPDRLRDESSEMDWTPSHSTFADFDPKPSRRLPEFVPSNSEPATKSPFWFRVPPAPITPAQRLRNPPNQPVLQLPSQERKENFFNSMTRRRPAQVQGDPVLGEDRRELNLAQPRFFHQAACDPASGLSEYMEKTWTLQPTISAPETVSAGDDNGKIRSLPTGGSVTHALAIPMLIIMFGGWRIAYKNDSLPLYNVTMGIMTFCVGLSLRTLSDYAIVDLTRRKVGIQSAIMMTFAGGEAVVAGYTMLEIWTGKGSSNFHELSGAILIGVMLVQEIWSLLL